MNPKQIPAQQMLSPGKLQPNPWNTNRMTPEAEDKLAESIRRIGMFKPVIVRELADGALQILGGEHRAQVAARIGVKEIPVINLGHIDDKRAKEIGLVDNGRYGADDTLQLAELLESLGSVEELTSFLPYSDTDFASIFSSTSISLDDLDLPDEGDEAPRPPKERPVQSHQVMRFKIPVDDCGWLSEMIERTMKQQGFTGSDAMTNAGDALVYLMNEARQ